MRPTIYTLEGYADTGNVATYRPDQSYFNQNFETLGAFYEVWRPSQLKKTAAVIGVIAGAAASVLPGGQVIGIPLAAASAGALTTAAAASAIHETYRDKSGNEIKLPQGTPPPEGFEQVEKKVNAVVPLVVGGIGVLAALAIAS